MSGGERRVVHFRGRVQGVGFRFTTVRIAADFTVTGYVQNLPDGQVLVVAEERPDKLDGFLDRLKTEMAPYIRAAQFTTSPASGEFDSFDVRY
jgi:acylphosphatase